MALTSSRPYLLRALYDWIIDGDEDPHIVVDCSFPYVKVPESHVKNQQIILNIAPGAITQLEMSNLGLTFQARFGGISTSIVLPYGSVTAIYGKESGLGMAFGQEPGGIPQQPDSEAHFSPSATPQRELNSKLSRVSSSDHKGKPDLRIVKPDD